MRAVIALTSGSVLVLASAAPGPATGGWAGLSLPAAIARLAASGVPVVYSSHVMDMVEKVCDDVLILHKGRVVAHDSVGRLRELAQAASLEEVFAALAVDQDVNRIGDELAAVALS